MQAITQADLKAEKLNKMCKPINKVTFNNFEKTVKGQKLMGARANACTVFSAFVVLLLINVVSTQEGRGVYYFSFASGTFLKLPKR